MSPVDKRKCKHSKKKRERFVRKSTGIVQYLKNCSPCYSKKPCANSAHFVACWFQGTQPISQHYNQAKSLPVGWLQEGHSDSHRTVG